MSLSAWLSRDFPAVCELLWYREHAELNRNELQSERMSAERRIYRHIISPKGSFHDVFLHMTNLLDEVTPMHTHTHTH